MNNHVREWDGAGTFAVDVCDRSGQLDVGAFKHFLQAVQLTVLLLYKAFSVTDQLPEFPLSLVWDKAGRE